MVEVDEEQELAAEGAFLLAAEGAAGELDSLTLWIWS